MQKRIKKSQSEDSKHIEEPQSYDNKTKTEDIPLFFVAEYLKLKSAAANGNGAIRDSTKSNNNRKMTGGRSFFVIPPRAFPAAQEL